MFPALAVKNQETGHLFLNDEDEFPESRVVIERGVAWEYTNSEEQESVQTTGPLKYGVLLMVSPSPWETDLLRLCPIRIYITCPCVCPSGPFPWRL